MPITAVPLVNLPRLLDVLFIAVSPLRLEPTPTLGICWVYLLFFMLFILVFAPATVLGILRANEFHRLIHLPGSMPGFDPDIFDAINLLCRRALHQVVNGLMDIFRAIHNVA